MGGGIETVQEWEDEEAEKRRKWCKDRGKDCMNCEEVICVNWHKEGGEE
jgi:hypothetical protein